MANIVTVTNTELVVRITGWDRLWALKREIRVPLANVQGAAVDPSIANGSPGLRAPGTHLPKVITAGNYRKDGGWSFWNVRQKDKAMVVALENERYARLVIDVEDPEGTVDQISRAIKGSSIAAA